MAFNSKIQLHPIVTKLARLLSLYAVVRNLQYEYRSYRDGRIFGLTSDLENFLDESFPSSNN